MEYEIYKEIIEKESMLLNRRERVALCIKCCERLAPVYLRFSEVENWGNQKTLLMCRQTAISWLQGNDVDGSDLITELEAIIPDSEDFGSALGTYAQNASIAHAYMLDQMKSEEPQPLLRVLDKCYETVDFYVQELLDPDCQGKLSNSQIENHELLVTEVNWQKNQLGKVKDQRNLKEFVMGDKIEPIINIA